MTRRLRPGAASLPRSSLPCSLGHHPGGSSSSADHLRAIVEEPGGVQTVVWERTGSAVAATGSWATAGVSLDAWAGDTIRIRFEALDGGSASTVEAGVDDIRGTRPAD